MLPRSRSVFHRVFSRLNVCTAWLVELSRPACILSGGQAVYEANR